jgi:hypothetical protein
LARRVRELVGEDGEAIAAYTLYVMNDERARTADRLEAAKWLADRGAGGAAVCREGAETFAIRARKLGHRKRSIVEALRGRNVLQHAQSILIAGNFLFHGCAHS